MNNSIVICRNCKYFKPSTEYLIPDNNISHGHCTHISSRKINIVLGIQTYEEAKYIRSKNRTSNIIDEDLPTCCGEDGYYYEKENNMAKILWREHYSYFVQMLFWTMFILFLNSIAQIT